MEVRGIRCQTCGGIIERKFENGDLVVDTSTNRGLYVIGYGMVRIGMIEIKSI